MTGLIRKVHKGLVAAGVVAIAGAASAGNGFIPSPVCYRNADNSGTCYGFFKSFRNTANQTDYASMRKNMYSNGYIDFSFLAQVNQVSYSCYAPAGSFFAKQTDTVVGNYLFVSWDTTGACTNILTANNSIAY